MNYFCKNCKHSFETPDGDEVKACPHCQSKHFGPMIVKALIAKTPVAAGVPQKKFYTSTGIVYGDTKEAWKSYHVSRDVKQCVKCGNAAFKNDHRHKERVCVKCGEIYPLSRNMK